MHQLRRKDFTHAEANIDRGTPKVGQNPFQELITNGPEFDFDVQDIARCRDETRLLMTRLSIVNWAWRSVAGLSPNGMPSSVATLTGTEAVAKPATDGMPSGEVALRSRILTLEHRVKRKGHCKTECQRLDAEANCLPWIAPVLGATLKEHHICCPLLEDSLDASVLA
jgi:hypothetical protein